MADQTAPKVTITQASELSPGLSLVTYSITGVTEYGARRRRGPLELAVVPGPSAATSAWSGQALVGTTGAGLLGGAERPSTMTAHALSLAIFYAECERRRAVAGEDGR